MQLKRLALLSLLVAACGDSGDDPPSGADASVTAADASLTAIDSSTPSVDAATGPADAMAPTPCTPSMVEMAADPLQAGDFTSGIIVDPSTSACTVENGTDYDPDRIVFFVLQGGQLGAGVGFGRSIDATSHAMTTGTYAGPLPDQTSVTIRVSDQATGQWDIRFYFDRANKTVRVTGFDLVTGS